MAYLNKSGLSHYDEKIKEYIGSHAGSPVGSLITGYGSSYEPYGGFAVMASTGGPVASMDAESYGSYLSPYMKGSKITGYESYGGETLSYIGVSTGSQGPVYMMSGSVFASAIGTMITPATPAGSQITGYSGVFTTGDIAKVGVFLYTGSPVFEVPFSTFLSKMEAEMGQYISTMTMTATGGDKVVFIHSGELYCMAVDDFKNI